MISGRDDNPAIPTTRWLSSAAHESTGAPGPAGPAATSIRQSARDDTPVVRAPMWLALGGKASPQDVAEPEGDLMIGGEELLIGGEPVIF